MDAERRVRVVATLSGITLAVGGPAALTAALLRIGRGQPRDYVFLYLGMVAALGVLRGLAPALVAAASSFLLVDYYLVRPVRTLTIADETDLANLLVFFGAAGVVGGLGSYRRRAQVRAERLSAELRDANDELVRLNREQAEAAHMSLRLAQTEQQLRALEETDRVRREVLANVSHELRTPISTILTESTSALAGSEVADETGASLSAIAGEAGRLAAMVSDLLDMARIEAGALDLRLEPIVLGEAVSDAVERLHRVSPDREVIWRSDEATVAVEADWTRLAQVLDNLLANADRYAPTGTRVEISVTSVETSATLRVRDHGPGISDDVRDRIFDRFVHGSQVNGAGGSGVGLGLAIVRGLVEAQAGSVRVETPSDGEGACFADSLPRRRL